MLRRKKKEPVQPAAPHKDTLILIGNGFDIWQGLNTSYSQFEEYYYAHREEILRKLRIKAYKIYGADRKPKLDQTGKPVVCSDVELLYGNPFAPDTGLARMFWHRFEDSLNKIDTQRLNLYFGKERRGLSEMKRSAHNAQRILRKAFCDWIGTIQLKGQETGYQFGDNCLFVNFNYTDTLPKRFRINPEDEYHIHGEATDPASIIFGHAAHPESPYQPLKRLGGRYQGLYIIEEILYDTDKHIEDNFSDLCLFFAIHGLMAGDIKQIYVLGHSFGPADIGYFRHIVNATQGIMEDPEEDLSEEDKAYLDQMDSLETFQMNVQYAVHGSYRSMGVIPSAYPPIIEGDPESERMLRIEAAAVRRRFLAEQCERNWRRDKVFMKMLRRAGKKGIGHSEMGPPSGGGETKAERPKETAPPQWHISYFSDEDKQRVESTMRRLKCQNFTMYPTIDACLERFRKPKE